MVRDHQYCLPCRTCPHDHRYDDFWDPACTRCVRALYTILTFDGPRISDLELYVQEALRWGIVFSYIETWLFDEEEALLHWEENGKLKHEPFHKWNLDRPPHFDLER